MLEWDECCTCTVRHVLWTFNLVVGVVAVMIIVSAGYLLDEFHNTEDLYFVKRDVTLGLLFTGVGILCLAVFGCVGSVREMSCALRLYATVLLLLVLFECVLSAVLLQYTGHIQGHELSDDIDKAVGCVWETCCRGWPSHHCKFDRDLCGELPSVFTSQDNCRRSESDYKVHISDWVREKLDPALAVLWLILVVQVGAAFLSCCLAGSRKVFRQEIVVVIRDESSPHNPTYVRLVEDRSHLAQRSKYRRLRAWFLRKLGRDRLHQQQPDSLLNEQQENRTTIQQQQQRQYRESDHGQTDGNTRVPLLEGHVRGEYAEQHVIPVAEKVFDEATD